MNTTKNLILIALILGLAIFITVWKTNQAIKKVPSPPPVIKPELPPPPANYDISPLDQNKWLNYSEIVSLMKQWNKEAPEITEFGIYGKTINGTDCTFLRIGTPGKPKVLIHATIHGNEKTSTGATLYMMQRMLYEYGRDDEITWLVKNRDVYWIPVLSPDSYLKSRYVEGVDPNRDYPHPSRRNHQSVSPIKNIRAFHELHRFKGVLSGHTWGSIYFWPSIGPKKDQEIHRNLTRKMSDLSGYDASRIGNAPAGYEIDFYYWRGAVAFVTEFGTGGHNQPLSSIATHGHKNYDAYMLFIKECPELADKLNPPSVCVSHTEDKRLE